MEDEVLEQEPVVETPTNSEMENVEESAVEEVNETPEKVDFEEPEVNENTEPVVEPEPLLVRTNGEWKLLSEYMGTEFETGKTYHISIKGRCQFMMSAKKPKFGIETNEITFTKEDGVEVWIKTRI